jgi:hypothetical protein
MWSGPRNISTALMRSWGNRPDTAVTDEPLYAHYLAATGKPHPGAAEVIAAGETDWRAVVADLTGPVPGGRPVWYQKHMTHHLLPHIDRGWLAGVTNCFLIRHPREMLNSYARVVAEPTADDTGFPQQLDIYASVRDLAGTMPPVVDAGDVLRDPRGSLGLLCDAVGVPFTDAMLSWPPGPRRTDGVWAKYWYAEVEASSGFRPHRPKEEPVPERFRDVYERCLECYQALYDKRLR